MKFRITHIILDYVGYRKIVFETLKDGYFNAGFSMDCRVPTQMLQPVFKPFLKWIFVSIYKDEVKSHKRKIKAIKIGDIL